MTATPESRAYNVLAASLTRRGDGLDLLVRTEAGRLTLHFSANLADGLLITPHIDLTAGRVKVGTRRVHPNSVPPEKRAKYIAAYVAWKTEPALTQIEACRRHGVPVQNFQSWHYNHRDELKAHLAALRPPQLKPSGALL